MRIYKHLLLLSISFQLIQDSAFAKSSFRIDWEKVKDESAVQEIQNNTLTRNTEPLVLKGKDLPEFIGANVSDLFVYAFRNENWSQIPFQIDERSSSDSYFAEDEIPEFDANDELVFLSLDLGDQAGSENWLDDMSSHSFPRYEIEIADGTNLDDKAWAYVFRSITLPIENDSDYVTVTSSGDSIFTPYYTAGFTQGDNKIFDYLAFKEAGGGTNVDILGRLKFRVSGTLGPQFLSMQFSLREDDFAIRINRFKDGRVRSILDTELSASVLTLLHEMRFNQIFYPSLILLEGFAPNIGFPEFAVVNDMRVSYDLNENAVGMTYFDSNNSQGLTVDGKPDNLNTATAFWSELTGEQGTIVRVIDFTLHEGSSSTYYFDDSQIDESDTGDKRSFGDNGISFTNPSGSISIRDVKFFVLSGNIGNVGEQFADFIRKPLQIIARDQSYDVITPGDVNADGEVNVQDLIKVINFILGIEVPTSEEKIVADINNDGRLNIDDLIAIINMILGLG